MAPTNIEFSSDMATTIATAGIGAVGKAILNKLKYQPQYKVLVLSRKVGLHDHAPLVSDKPV